MMRHFWWIFNHYDCTWLLSISAPIAIKNDGLSNGFTCPDKVILNDSRIKASQDILFSLFWSRKGFEFFCIFWLFCLRRKRRLLLCFARRHFCCFFAPRYSPNLCKTLQREATERFQVCPTCDTVFENQSKSFHFTTLRAKWAMFILSNA